MTPEQILESLKAQLRGTIKGIDIAQSIGLDEGTYLHSQIRKEENENILLSIEKMEQIDKDN